MWKPGESGNTKGRPKKERALTYVLEKAFGNGKKKSLVALVVQGLLTSQIGFDDAVDLQDENLTKKRRIINLQADEWLQLLRFLYAQVDGPPPQKLEHSGPDGSLIEIGIPALEELLKLDPGELTKRYCEAISKSPET